MNGGTKIRSDGNRERRSKGAGMPARAEPNT